jgi:translation initiation factor 1 (eIF-1/SUI1)
MGVKRKDADWKFWRIENKKIFIYRPVITFWLKFRVGMSVLVAMVTAAFAMLLIFRPMWFHLADPHAAYIIGPIMLLAGVIQMLLMLNSSLGCMAVVQNDCINVRGRRYFWKQIRGISVDASSFGPKGQPALKLHVATRKSEKLVTIIPEGLAGEQELDQLARHIQKLIQQLADKRAAKPPAAAGN